MLVGVNRKFTEGDKSASLQKLHKRPVSNKDLIKTSETTEILRGLSYSKEIQAEVYGTNTYFTLCLRDYKCPGNCVYMQIAFGESEMV